MDQNTLSSIDSRHHRDVQSCLREMLIRRLQWGSPLSWRVLCDCLRSPTVGRDDVAAEIEQGIGRQFNTIMDNHIIIIIAIRFLFSYTLTAILTTNRYLT